MQESVQLNFPNKVLAPNIEKVSSLSTKNDLESHTSFEDVLTSANDQVNNKDQKFWKKELQQDDQKEPLLFSADVFTKLFAGSLNLGNDPAAQLTREEKPAVKNVDPQTQNNDKQIPRSLRDAAAAASQKMFSDITPEFKQLLTSAGKDFDMRALQLTSDLKIPQVSLSGLFDELVKKVQFLKDGDVSNLKLELLPKDLGKVDVWMSMQDKKLVLQIYASPEAKKMIEDQMKDLQNVLTAQGFTIEHAEVGVFTGMPGNTQQHAYFELSNGKKVAYQDYDMLKLVGQADIINSLNKWVADIMVNYIA